MKKRILALAAALLLAAGTAPAENAAGTGVSGQQNADAPAAQEENAENGNPEGRRIVGFTMPYGDSTLTFSIRKSADDEYCLALVDFTPVRDLVIPGEVRGLTVLGIEMQDKVVSGDYEKLREKADMLETLVIEEGVQFIVGYDFCNYPHLKSVTLPKSMTKIGAFSFYNCRSLTEVSVPEDGNLRTIDGSAFGRVGFDDLALPGGKMLSEMPAVSGMRRFSTCADGWEYVRLADGTAELTGVLDEYAEAEEIEVPSVIGGHPVSVLGEELFAFRDTLRKVVLPEGIREIKRYAFCRCPSLSGITLPDSLETVGDGAFAGIDAERPELPSGAETGMFWYCPRIRTDESGEWDYALLEDGTAVIVSWKTGTERLKFPDTVNGITVSAVGWVPAKRGRFENEDVGLQTATLPKGVRVIEDGTFSGCSRLRSIGLSQSLVRIGKNAFLNCEKLSNVKLGEGLKEIDDYAFSGAGMGSVVIPDSVEKLGTGVFKGCAVTGITFPKTLGEIPDSLCESASRLKSIKLPDTVTRIGANAFAECYSLASVTLPEGLVSIGEYAFSLRAGTLSRGKAAGALRSVRFPDSLESIGSYAFYRSDALTDVAFAAGSHLTEIGDSAFESCERLKEIQLPDVDRIGDRAFAGCTALKKADLGRSLTVVGKEAFLRDAAMTELTVPNTLTQIGDGLLDEHGEGLTVVCGNGSAAQTWVKDRYPEVPAASSDE